MASLPRTPVLAGKLQTAISGCLFALPQLLPMQPRPSRISVCVQRGGFFPCLLCRIALIDCKSNLYSGVFFYTCSEAVQIIARGDGTIKRGCGFGSESAVTRQ